MELQAILDNRPEAFYSHEIASAAKADAEACADGVCPLPALLHPLGVAQGRAA